MKKLSKINLKLDKEVISPLSGNEMDQVKGGTVTDPIPFSVFPNLASCDCQPRTQKLTECNCYTNVCVVGPTKECIVTGAGCINV